MSTFTFPDASDASTNSTDTYTINHEINLIKLAIRSSISNKTFYAKISNSPMTSMTYNISPTVTISGNGSGATASALIGEINSITLYSQMNSLRDIPTIQIEGDGTGATAHCDVLFGINSIKLLSFYQFTNQNITLEIQGTGTGCAATPVFNSQNYLIGITVTSQGSGYDLTNTFIKCFDSNNNQIQLSYNINYTNGIVDKIVVDSSGYGYTWANVKFTVQGRFEYNGILATANIDDGISDLIITNPGTGYDSSTTVTITGGYGSGATVTPTISNGMVVGLSLTNPGTGYSINNSKITGNTYFNAWQGVLVDNNMSEALNEQMESVISYFQGQGYCITRMKGCNNLFYWLINW